MNEQNRLPPGAGPNRGYPIYPPMSQDEMRLTALLERIELRLRRIEKALGTSSD